MATRFYLSSSGTPDVTPSSWSAGWNTTSSAVGTFLCSSVARNTAMTDAAITYNTAPTIAHEAVVRFVSSKPLAGQTFTGSVSGVIRGLESNAGNNATVAFGIKTIKPNGSHGHYILSVSASDNTAAVGIKKNSVVCFYWWRYWKFIYLVNSYWLCFNRYIKNGNGKRRRCDIFNI